MTEEKKIEVPEWIIQKAMSVLAQNHRAIEEQCCLKRQTASAYNYLALYLRGDVKDEELEKVAVNYLDGRIKQFNQQAL